MTGDGKRVLKFRAWDIKQGKMAGVKEIYFDPKTCLPSVLGCVYQVTMSEAFGEGGNEPYDVSEESIDEENIILEQFTGLRDKNGREIYEGDIIRDPVTWILWDIFWNENWATFEERSIKNPIQHYSLSRETSANCEVIGSIHETPELLK
jgi:hypothetical protein